MALQDYICNGKDCFVFDENFDPNDWSFPCCCCKYAENDEEEHPCCVCGYNANV